MRSPPPQGQVLLQFNVVSTKDKTACSGRYALCFIVVAFDLQTEVIPRGMLPMEPHVIVGCEVLTMSELRCCLGICLWKLRVTGTGGGLQAGLIEDRDHSALAANESAALQIAGSHRDTHSAYTQHVCEELMG